MFCIIGVERIVWKLHEIHETPVTVFLNRQLNHPAWDKGFTLFDLIWLVFQFIVGVVLPVSLKWRQQRGDTAAALHLYVARRTLIVFFVGVLVSGPLSYDLSKIAQVTWRDVLQQIAACYLAAALLVTHANLLMQTGVATAILIGCAFGAGSD